MKCQKTTLRKKYFWNKWVLKPIKNVLDKTQQSHRLNGNLLRFRMKHCKLKESICVSKLFHYRILRVWLLLLRLICRGKRSMDMGLMELRFKLCISIMVRSSSHLVRDHFQGWIKGLNFYNLPRCTVLLYLRLMQNCRRIKWWSQHKTKTTHKFWCKQFT